MGAEDWLRVVMISKNKIAFWPISIVNCFHFSAINFSAKSLSNYVALRFVSLSKRYGSTLSRSTGNDQQE